MSVYVDDTRARFGRMVMCHMIADSREELFAMADTIGVPRHHVQYWGWPREHFDICMTKRALALKHGAIPITRRKLIMRVRSR